MDKPTTPDSYIPSLLDDSPRLSILLDAVVEIDALARELPRHFGTPSDEYQSHLIARGMAGRMLRLTKALMDGLTEKDVTTESLAQVVMLEGITQG